MASEILKGHASLYAHLLQSCTRFTACTHMDPAEVHTAALDGSPSRDFFGDFFGHKNCSSTKANCRVAHRTNSPS